MLLVTFGLLKPVFSMIPIIEILQFSLTASIQVFLLTEDLKYYSVQLFRNVRLFSISVTVDPSTAVEWAMTDFCIAPPLSLKCYNITFL